MKILILKPSSLGDVVQALPVLRLLKRHLPASEIHWWIDRRLAPMLEDDPDLTGLIRFDREGWTSPRAWLAAWRRLLWARRQSFDWVIDLQSLARSGAFAWLANGRFTIGMDEPREGARGYYDVIVPRPSFHTHAVDWYLSVLPRLGVPVNNKFEWLKPRPSVAAGLRRKWPIDGSRWVILQPGARWWNKRWSADNFAELLRRLVQAYTSLRFAVLGGPEDQVLGKSIAGAVPGCCLDLTGQLSLPEMVEWIRLCELMVTNDTGPMHVAAALGRPVVALMGPTEPRRTGPYGQPGSVLQLDLQCAPCLKPRCSNLEPLACLRQLTVPTVYAAVARRLSALSLPEPGR